MYLQDILEKINLVNFKGPKSAIGQLVDVKIIEAKTWTLDGEMVEIHEPVEVK